MPYTRLQITKKPPIHLLHQLDIMPRGRTRRATTRRTKADKEKDEAESTTTTPAGSANNSDDDDEQQQQQQQRQQQPENSKKTNAATTKAAPATRRSRRARKPTSKVVGSPGGRKNAAASANSNKRGAPKKKDDEDGSNEEDDDDAGSEGEDDNKDQVDDDDDEEEEETERSGKDDLEEDDTSSKKKEANDDESDDEEDGSSKKGGAEDEGDDDDDSADDDKPIASLAKGGRRAAAVAAKSKKGTRATKAAAAKPGTGRRATRRSSRTLSEGDDESDHKTAAKNKKTPITRRRKRGISAKSSEDESQASSSKGKRARTTRKTRGQSKNESDNDSDSDDDDDVDDENGVSSDNDEKGDDAMSVEAGDDAVGAKGSGKANDNDSADDQESDDYGAEDEKAATTGRRTRGRQQKKGKPAAAAATDKQTGKSKQQRGNQAAGKTKEQQKEAEKPVTRKKRTRGAAKKQQDSSSDEGESSPEEDGDSNNEKADDSNKTTNKTGKGNGKDSDSRADESEDVDEDNKNSESESEHSKTSGRKASSDRKHLNNRSQIQSSSDADEAMSTTEEATKDATGKSQQKATVSLEDESKDPIGRAEPEEKNQQNDPPEKEEVIEIDEEDDDDKTDKSSKAEKDSIKVGEQDVIDDNKSANTASDKVKDDAEVTVVSGSNKKIKQDPPEENGDSGDASEIPEPMETADVSDKQNAKPEGKTGVDVEEVEMEEAPKEEHMLPTGLGNGEVADKTDQGGKARPSPGNAGSSKTERQTSITDAPTTSANFGKGEVKEGDSSDVVEQPEERPLSKEEVKDKTEIARGEDAPEKSSAAPPKTQQLVETHKTDSTREEQGSSADVRKANEKEKSESTKDEPTTPENQAKVTKESLSVGKASAAARAEAITDDNISLKEKVSTEALGEDEVETTPVNGASGNVSAKVSQGIQSNGVLPSDAPKDSAAPDDHAEAAFTEQNAGESGVHDGDTEAIIQSEAREEPDALELASNQTDPTPKSPLADDAAIDTANEKAALEPPVKQSLPEDKPELMPVQAESVGDKPNVVVTSGNEVAGGKTIVVEEKAPGNAATSSKGMSFEPSTPSTTPPQPPVVMQVGDSATKDTIDQSIVLAASDGPDKLAEEDEGSAMEVDAIDDTQVKRSLESNIEDVGPDNAEASPPVKRARVLSDAEASPSLSEFKSHDTSVPEEPEEPPEPPEPIEEVHVKRCDLDKIKAMLFSAGSLVHRGRGFEKMFSEYWGAISLIVVGDQDAKIIAKLRKVVKSFLKTKRLRKLHNALILGKFGKLFVRVEPSWYNILDES